MEVCDDYPPPQPYHATMIAGPVYPYQLTILHVEDEAGIRDYLRGIIQDWPMIELIQVGSLAEMRPALRERRFDLIILDIHLPDGDGLDEVPAIRSLQPGACVYPCTIEDDRSYIARRSVVGVSGWISKNVVEFFDEVNRLLDQLLRGVLPDCPGTQRVRWKRAGDGLLGPTDFLFVSNQRPLENSVRRFLKAIVDNSLHCTRSVARERVADAVGRSLSSLKDFAPDRGLPNYGTLVPLLITSHILLQVWRDPSRGLEYIGPPVSTANHQTMYRWLHRYFSLTPSEIVDLPDLWTVSIQEPVPVCFIHDRPSPSRDGLVTIRVVVRP
jgi:CheY-like chemotaxis protein